MMPEELLKPRFKVIADYPDSKFKIGAVLRRIKYSTNEWYSHDDYEDHKSIHLEDLYNYPHLFKKLEWWEEREEKDLPEYLKKTGKDFDVVGENEIITLADFMWWGFNNDKTTWKSFYPATKEEYEKQRSNNQ